MLNDWVVQTTITSANQTRATPRQGICKSRQICRGHLLPVLFFIAHNKTMFDLEKEGQGHDVYHLQ